ncbi:MAG: LytR/AlgR family response regulator transcription factor [Terriglobales bacterium]
MPARLRTILVDDEPLARQLLRGMLARLPQVELVAECANGLQALDAVTALAPDLLLLDIQMPRLNGFEVLDLLPSEVARNLAVVFVTAHDEHALRAFEVHAVDYLLKPYTAERLAEAIRRAVEHRGQPPAPAELAARLQPQPLPRLVVRDGAKVTIIPLDRLDYAQAQDDYVALVSEGKSHLKQQTLGALEAALDPTRFIRIHRSYLVRLAAIARIESQEVVLASGARLPLSRTGAQRLRAALVR